MSQEALEGLATPRCFKCEAVANRACTLCGRFFCGEHGGKRLVWLDSTGGTLGPRTHFTQRVVCDACTPSPWPMRLLLLLVFAVLALFLVFGLLRA